MSFQIRLTAEFRRDAKRLSKKQKSLPDDINRLVQQLLTDPHLGTSIGHSCYKIRLAIASKGAGKRGGARVVTYVQVVNETVFLLAIYDKSEQATITNQQVLRCLGCWENNLFSSRFVTAARP